MNRQSVEPEYTVVDQEEMWATEKPHNCLDRDFSQVVVDLADLQERSRLSVAMSLEIANSIQELVQWAQELQ